MSNFIEKQRILIYDDDEDSYNKIRTFLENDYECEAWIHDEATLRKKLKESYKKRTWYQFILIDLDLSLKHPDGVSGVQLYDRIYREYPNETYIIYSKAYVNEFKDDIARLSHLGVKFMLFDEAMSDESIALGMVQTIPYPEPNKIFLVHGRNVAKRDQITTLLERGFGLDVTSWEEARESDPGGKNMIWDIVLQGINMSHLTLVLFTDDENVELKEGLISELSEDTIRTQSRPNVFIEAGYAMGIRPLRTIFLEWVDDNSLFGQASDFSGMHLLKYNDTVDSREILKNRLEAARCLLKINRNWKKIKLAP